MTREEETSRAALEYANEEIVAAPYDAFMAGAQWADAHPHWISVEDELPKKGQSCIILIDRKALQGTLRIRSAVYAPNVMMQQEGFAYNRMSKKHHITHWMPLPSIEHFRETTKMIEKGGDQ